MKETFERNYKYSYRIFSLYKSITEEDRAFIWRIELSTRNRQFPKIAKCPLCANPHRHSQISPRDNPDNERDKVKKQSGTVVSLKPEAAVTSHLRPCPVPFRILSSSSSPIHRYHRHDSSPEPSLETRLPKRAKEGTDQRGGEGGFTYTHAEFIRRLTRFKLWHLN